MKLEKLYLEVTRMCTLECEHCLRGDRENKYMSTKTIENILKDVKKEYSNNAGIVIGLTLVLVHLLGIKFTGTSVNPARSLAPALLQGGQALSQLWVFIVAPLVGSALASIFYNFVLKDEK